MGLMDNMGSKAKDMMDDPDKRQQIEKIAEEKGITIDQAKAHFTSQQDHTS